MTATISAVGALSVFAFAASVTPGPNNTMLLASGVNFGIRRTLPHLAGISAGIFAMLLAVGFGLGSVFRAFPAAYVVLRAAGGAYLLFLAWKIATAEPASAGAEKPGSPMGFWKAAAFQWVNPKAWIIAVGAIGAYVPEGSWAGVPMVAAVFTAVAAPSAGAWAVFGTSLRGLLRSGSRLRAVNIAMAVLLVLSLYPLLFGE